MPTLGNLAADLSKAIPATLATYLYLNSEITPDLKQLEALAATTASSAATILGFLITALALLASIMDRSLLVNLRMTGGYRVLIRNGFICGALFLFLLTLCIAYLLPWENNHKQYLLPPIIFFAALSLTHLATTGHKFYKVIASSSRIK